eukprot:CAMPEP_0170597314 /NCGR_PEP_ID=MMETSP0224-20130122/15643_1 /TAXON_ID=285029 /ORGANISM="Togula jolla, Strain CCCM 725" /LENGTH=508 /DNA_ID=CAMNT_0010921781 /DNA_START=73 /DNA_END=1602 /DNA_ORIENTATION=+
MAESRSTESRKRRKTSSSAWKDESWRRRQCSRESRRDADRGPRENASSSRGPAFRKVAVALRKRRREASTAKSMDSQACRSSPPKGRQGSRSAPPKDREGSRSAPPKPVSLHPAARSSGRARGRSAASPPRSTQGYAESREGSERGTRHRALFLMGLPGAGKSTVKRRRLQRGEVDIEPDLFKKHHPRYSDQMSKETDEEVHRWSVRRAADAFDNAITSPRRPSLVFDSSGSNARWLGQRIAAARRQGYRTELLWVDVPVEVAIFRNRNRAKHGRWCPESVILDKAAVMRSSFNELREQVDGTERLQNWSERSLEWADAELDVYLYPPPRARPPCQRPGDSGYGEAPPGAQSPSPTRGSMRTIRIGPWKRGEEVAKRKNERLAWMDQTYRGNREKFVLEQVLGRRDVLIEPNKYPYQLPRDIEHWTIWSRRDFGHRELCEYVEAWLDARRPHNVKAWNYDDNRGRRTIDIWHVHIYFQGAGGLPPTISSKKSSSGDGRPSSHRSPCSV